MGSGSAARALRLNEGTAAAPQMAKVIPFRFREPLADVPRQVFPCGQKQEGAPIIQINKLFEAKHQQKEKGVIRRAAEPPSDHWLLAWVVWLYYVTTYSKAGLRVSEESRKVEFHQRSVSGLGK